MACGRCRAIVRLVTGPPLDVAADARCLHRRQRACLQQGVASGAKIVSGHWHSVTGAAAVELTAINERARAIEQKQIGRARGAKRFGYLLALIEEIRERVARVPRFLAHPVRTIVGELDDVVRVDGDDREAANLVLARETGKLLSDVAHERTVMADERHEQRRCITPVIGRDETSVEIRQTKRW